MKKKRGKKKKGGEEMTGQSLFTSLGAKLKDFIGHRRIH